MRHVGDHQQDAERETEKIDRACIYTHEEERNWGLSFKFELHNLFV